MQIQILKQLHESVGDTDLTFLNVSLIWLSVTSPKAMTLHTQGTFASEIGHPFACPFFLVLNLLFEINMVYQ